jgi:hypothetical protein
MSLLMGNSLPRGTLGGGSPGPPLPGAWQTEDGGYWLTEDGGRWLTE